MKDSVAIIIPARFASVRLPGKPLQDILGKPMIQWVWENARKVKRASRVIIATDSTKIAETVRGFGGEAVLTKEEHFSGTDRVAEVAENLNETIIVNVQGDEPFLSPAKIDLAIDTIWEETELNMGSLMTPIASVEALNDTTEVRVVVDKNSNALYFTRSVIPFIRDVGREKWLQCDAPFFNHVGIYVYRRNFLLNLVTLPPSQLEKFEKLEQLRVLENGYNIRMKIIEESTICVDTEEDLARARNFAQNMGIG